MHSESEKGGRGKQGYVFPVLFVLVSISVFGKPLKESLDQCVIWSNHVSSFKLCSARANSTIVVRYARGPLLGVLPT